jgi:hypothetical protein
MLRAVSPRRWLVQHCSFVLWLASSAAVGYGSAPYCAGESFVYSTAGVS